MLPWVGTKSRRYEKKKIEDAKKELEEAVKGDDVPAIKAKTEVLTTASYSIAEKLYKAEQAAGGPSAAEQRAKGGGTGEPGDAKDAEVVDAEFEVKDEPSKN